MSGASVVCDEEHDVETQVVVNGEREELHSMYVCMYDYWFTLLHITHILVSFGANIIFAVHGPGVAGARR